MTQTLEQVSWSEYRHSDGEIKYSANTPFEKFDGISIMRFNKPITLVNLGFVPQEYDDRGSPIKIENRAWWIMAKPTQITGKECYDKSERGSVVIDTRLSIDQFVGYDTPTHQEVKKAYFKNGDLVAVSGIKDREIGSHLSFPKSDDINLLNIFRREIRMYAHKHGYDNPDAFKRFQQHLMADSPSGQGLHNSYREAIAGILPKNFMDEMYRIEVEGPD